MGRLGRWLTDRWTNYRSRYGYPAPQAVVAELWWRIEHTRLDNRMHAGRRRKKWEHRGAEAGHAGGCTVCPCRCDRGSNRHRR